GRPSFTPWATARLRPAFIRCRVMVRSNSAKAPVSWKTSLPIGVVVSMACWSRYSSSVFSALQHTRLEDTAQCLLIIIGATPEGRKELVGLTDGVRESA